MKKVTNSTGGQQRNSSNNHSLRLEFLTEQLKKEKKFRLFEIGTPTVFIIIIIIIIVIIIIIIIIIITDLE